MTAHKSKVLKLKLDEDPLQNRIYLFSFMESPDMILSQYKETCEVLPYYPAIGGEDINIMLKRQLVIFYMKILMSAVDG